MSDVSDRLAATIPNAIPDELVTGWVVFIETIDGEGKSALHLEHFEGMKAWSYLGIIEYAKQLEMACTVKEVTNE